MEKPKRTYMHDPWTKELKSRGQGMLEDGGVQGRGEIGATVIV